MENFLVSLAFLGGLACLIAVGHLIGHILRLDQYYVDAAKKNKELKKRNKNYKHEIHA